MAFGSRLGKLSALALAVLAVLALTGLLASASGAQAHHGKRAHKARGHKGRAALGQARRIAERSKHSGQRSPAGAAFSKPSPLLFRATSLREFPVAQSAPGAITEAPDPAGSGETVFKMTVPDNDGYPVPPTENPRAELISPATINSGDEIWWSAKFFLPEDF